MRYFILCLLLVAGFSMDAQTQWSGVVNTYHEVTAYDPCGTVTVSDATGLEVGQPVLLIQMQGASVNTTNTDQFGTITDYGNAGNYEVNAITDITGNIVQLENRLLQGYDSGQGFQLVGGAEAADNATVTGTVIAQPWDGSVGGVIYLEVGATLNLTADVDASGAGYRGGVQTLVSNNNCNAATFPNNYFYAPGNWRGAPKGEGYARVDASISWGRGAVANGGGGGNDHNTGGGGGGNQGTGGMGGEQTPPSVFGCKGLSPGIGGDFVPPTSLRLFMGGGGGAGHVNNGTVAGGGNGGGIVLVRAARIETALNTAFKADGVGSPVSSGDGGNGGGAGGTVYVLADIFATTFDGNALSARGAAGSNVTGASNRCFGPGGGGSGGSILTNAAIAALPDAVAGGAAGINSDATSCGNPTNGATAGDDGFFDSGASPFKAGAVPNSSVQYTLQPVAATNLCPSDTICLQLIPDAGNLDAVEWQFSTGTDFTTVDDLPDTFQPDLGTLKYVVNADTPTEISFRALPTAACYTTQAVDSEVFTVLPTIVATFSQSLTDQTVTVMLTDPTGVDSVRYDFGAGDPPVTGNSATNTYAAPGTYTITATAYGPCGPVTSTQTVTIAITAMPAADFTAGETIGCAPFVVTFDNGSTDAATYQWTFPGGTPSASTDPTPTVTYNQTGTFDVRLIAANSGISDTLIRSDYIVVDTVPTADFLIDLPVPALSIVIIDQSTGADSYFYDFGDGATSTEPAPAHTFAEEGSVIITQIVTNACGSDTLEIPFFVFGSVEAQIGSSTGGGCAPFLVTFTNISPGNTVDQFWNFPGGSPATSNDSIVNVLYDTPGRYPVTLSVFGPGGADTESLADSIDVRPFPTSDFTFQADALTVGFTSTAADTDTHTWDFGDGNSSNEVNPVHTYAAAGLYDVTLTASNPYCASAQTYPVLVELTSTSSVTPFGAVAVRPSPFSRDFILEVDQVPAGARVQLIDLHGRLLHEEPLSLFSTRIQPRRSFNGVCLLRVLSPAGNYTQRLVRLR